MVSILSYQMAQVLTGYGCFDRSLYTIHKRQDVPGLRSKSRKGWVCARRIPQVGETKGGSPRSGSRERIHGWTWYWTPQYHRWALGRIRQILQELWKLEKAVKGQSTQGTGRGVVQRNSGVRNGEEFSAWTAVLVQQCNTKSEWWWKVERMAKNEGSGRGRKLPVVPAGPRKHWRGRGLTWDCLTSASHRKIIGTGRWGCARHFSHVEKS